MDHQPPAPPDPRSLGIDAGHHDGFGAWCVPSDRTLALIRGAMGLEPGQTPPGPQPLVVDRRATLGQDVHLPPGSEVLLEDGTLLAAASHPLYTLPVGYHRLLDPEGGDRPLLVSPGRCHLQNDLRIWGLTAQLYAARSSQSWGIGDLGDLSRLVDWAAERGAGLVGLNPLHVPTPTGNPPNSPYSPSSRRWRDPLLIAIERVPGFTDLPDAAERSSEGRRLNELALVDRAAAWSAKRSALEELWGRFRQAGGDADFDRYQREHGDDLERWGVFCTVADDLDRQGRPGSWREWPADLQRPDGAGVARTIREQGDQVRFWSWLQWLIDRQLADAPSAELVLTDLAVGFSDDGFDAWDWQDLVAHGVHIGAPPDPLGRDGQDWGLPPFIPWRLAADGYRPLAATMRAAFRHSRGVRIDHVMGLFRLFWIPPECSAADGAYVRFAGQDLLRVLAIESSRAEGIVVGEDLGTVEDGVRETLSDAGVLSTRLLWFEDTAPQWWPVQAQAAVTTHDLPTTAGVWSGADLADLEAAGVSLPPDGHKTLRHHLRSAGGCDDDASVDHVVVEAHRAVAASPSMVATAALDDLLGALHRPNVPGTIDEHPNWRIPLPVPLDDLPGHPLAEAVAQAMGDHR